tara:strand:+ start:87 stop:665 length:579 start_codon:yes stop_codon:yes gene_type:complete
VISSSDLIWIKKGSLTKSFCNNLIKKFDKEPNISDGITLSGYKPDVKQTKDFVLSGNPLWKNEDAILYKALQLGLTDYVKHLVNINPTCCPDTSHKLSDTGYKLQRYEPNGFYTWHNDWTLDRNGSRVYTFIWYLNTLQEEDEGYTEFIDGTKIQPKCGNLLFFPATWTYVHRGYPPKVRKYICNGWFYSKP